MEREERGRRERKVEESKMERKNGSCSRETDNRCTQRDGEDSDEDEAADTGMSTGPNAVVGNVVEPRSAYAHRAHRAMPSPGHARRETGE